MKLCPFKTIYICKLLQIFVCFDSTANLLGFIKILTFHHVAFIVSMALWIASRTHYFPCSFLTFLAEIKTMFFIDVNIEHNIFTFLPVQSISRKTKTF